MIIAEPPTKQKKRLKRFAKAVLLSSVCLAVIVFSLHLVWRYSGSNQWELVQEKDGITIYALKSPGSTLKQFKGIARVRSTLSAAMTLAQDPAVCEYARCYESRMIERVDERLQYYTFRWKYPFRFRPREMVIKEQFSRVPETKALLVEVTAAPDKIPPTDCCVRITNMYNTWRFTPLKNGEIEIEYLIDMSEGGFMPYVLSNFAVPKFMYFVLSKMQMVLDKESQKYPNAKFDLLEDK
jgi:hypothetical protein